MNMPFRWTAAALVLLPLAAGCSVRVTSASPEDADAGGATGSDPSASHGSAPGASGAPGIPGMPWLPPGVGGGTASPTCGGPAQALCKVGEACAAGAACSSGVCTGGTCAAPSPKDNVKNGDETDVDCGGSSGGAPRCADTAGCVDGADCTSLVCAAGKCAAPTAEDRVKNGAETDVDCGGPAGAPRCADGLACADADDCASRVCVGGKCATPSPTDKVKNGDESDVDCGGSGAGAPRCEVGQLCRAHGDCASGGCAYDGKCALAPSCTRHFGGDTCGSGEVGSAGATHESCCATRTLPSGVKLDRYQITAGRMRAFLERTQGNVIGWYEGAKASLPAEARAQIDAYKAYLPSDDTSYPWGVNYQLGGFIYLPGRPSGSQGCFVGNAQSQGYGSHTYWLPGNVDSDDRSFSKDLLDEKALNCVTFPMIAAFCAWDGGRVATREETDTAYGPSKYPWGASPEAGGFAYVDNGWNVVGPATDGFGRSRCPTCSATMTNWRNAYQFPAGGDPLRPWDYAYWISAPGRFPKDVGPYGHFDLAGNLMEMTASFDGTDSATINGTSYTMPRSRWSKNGSWEGHPAAYGRYTFAILTKYGKTGGRCVKLK